MANQELFEFKYLKDVNDLDINTLVDTQKEFNIIINEIKNKHFPDTRIKVKIQPFKEGSFIVEQLIEIVENSPSTVGSLIGGAVYAAGSALYEHRNKIVKIIGIFKDLVEIRKLLKGEKPIDVQESRIPITTTDSNNTTAIDSHNNFTTVYNITVADGGTFISSPEAWKEYQTNSKINKAIDKTIEALDKDNEINGFQVIDKTNPIPVINVNRAEFEGMKAPNPYLTKPEEVIEEVNKAILHVKTIDYLPNDKSKYEFIYKEKVQKFKITAPSFLASLASGERFGKGDILVTKLKIYKKLDTAKDVYIPYKYELSEVIEIKKDNIGTQGTLF